MTITTFIEWTLSIPRWLKKIIPIPVHSSCCIIHIQRKIIWQCAAHLFNVYIGLMLGCTIQESIQIWQAVTEPSRDCYTMISKAWGLKHIAIDFPWCPCTHLVAFVKYSFTHSFVVLLVMGSFLVYVPFALEVFVLETDRLFLPNLMACLCFL